MINRFIVQVFMSLLFYAVFCNAHAEDFCSEQYTRNTNIYSSSSASVTDSMYEQAIEDLTGALDKCKNNANIMRLLADFKMIMGENEDAIKLAEQAIQLAPEDWMTNFTYGQVTKLMGHMKKGLRYIKKATELSPVKYKYNVLLNYCISLDTAGEYNEAVKICSELIKVGKNTGPAHYIRGRAYHSIREFAKSKADFRQAKELGFNGAQYYTEEHYNN